MKVFDIVTDLSQVKNDLSRNANRDEFEKEYNPFMINKAFSMHVDTCMYAAQMNELWELDKQLQHDYFLHALSPKKRFGWIKGDEKDKSIELVAKVYNVNLRRAKDILALLTPEQIKAIHVRSEFIA